MRKASINFVPFDLKHRQSIFSNLLKKESNYNANEVHTNFKMRDSLQSNKTVSQSG